MKKIIYVLLFLSVFSCSKAQKSNWEIIYNPQKNESPWNIFVKDDYVFASIELTDLGWQFTPCVVYVSSNDGLNWSKIRFGDEDTIAYYDFKNIRDTIYIHTVSEYLKPHKDNMLQWEHTYGQYTPNGRKYHYTEDILQESEYEPELICDIGKNIIWGDFNSGVYYSEDNSESYKKSNLDKTVQSFFVLDSKLFACSFSGLYVSKDSGKTFISIPEFEDNSEYPANSVEKIVSAGSNLFALAWNGVSVSTNGGETWAIKNPKFLEKDSCEFRDIIAIDDCVIVCKNGKIYVSQDFGDNWTDKSEGLKPHYGNRYWQESFGKNNKYLFFSCGTGIYRRELKEITDF